MLGRIYTDSGIWAGMALEQRQDAASTTSEMISPFLPYLRTTFDMLRLLLTFVLMIPLYNRFTSSSSSLFQLAGGRAVWIVLEGKVPPPRSSGIAFVIMMAASTCLYEYHLR